jgi:hypothetical protein
MGVVRIDDGLEKDIEALLSKSENRFKYPSKTAFLNIMISDYLNSQKKKKKEV